MDVAAKGSAAAKIKNIPTLRFMIPPPSTDPLVGRRLHAWDTFQERHGFTWRSAMPPVAPPSMRANRDLP